ncbi:ATPase, F1 complex, gamma subunit domain containing protein [Lactarius tabidus]
MLLRAIELHLKSVKNIEKITKSMGIIASMRLSKAQRVMQTGKQHSIANSEVFQNAKVEEAPKHKLFIVIPWIRAMCCSINTGENSGSTDSSIVVVVNQIGHDIPTYVDTTGVADLVVKSGIKYNAIAVVYKEFVSEPGVWSNSSSNGMKAYKMEVDATKNLAEFSLANAIYATLVKGHTREISARCNSMDNAQKNASDMISSLQMQYNHRC